MTQDSHSQMQRDYAESIMALPCDPYQVVEVDCVTPVIDWCITSDEVISRMLRQVSENVSGDGL